MWWRCLLQLQFDSLFIVGIDLEAIQYMSSGHLRIYQISIFLHNVSQFLLIVKLPHCIDNNLKRYTLPEVKLINHEFNKCVDMRYKAITSVFNCIPFVYFLILLRYGCNLCGKRFE